MGMDSLAGIDTAEKRINDIAMTGWSYSHDREMQRSQADYNKQIAKEVNSHMAQLQREARLSGPSDLVAGLRMAGLNPALASGDTFASTSSGGGSGVGAPSSAPSRESSSMGKLAIEAIKYQDAERDLMRAQAENLRADAAEKKSRIPGNNFVPENIQSNTELNKSNAAFNAAKERNLEAQNRLLDSQSRLFNDDYVQRVKADKSIESMAKTYSELVANDPKATPFDKGIAQTLSEVSGRGAVDGLDKFIDLYGKNSDTLARGIYNKLVSEVMSGQLNDKKVLEALRKMPETERNNLLAQSAQLAAVTELAKSQKNLTDEEKKKVTQQIELIKAQTKATYHGDVAAMFNAGDWSSLGSKLGYDGLVSIMQGVSHGLASGGVLGFFSKFFGNNTTTTTTTTSSTPPIYNGSGQVVIPGQTSSTQMRNVSH